MADDLSMQQLLKAHSGIRLDIGCGKNKQAGFVGLDMRGWPGVDIVHDVEVYPWPLPDESVIVAVCTHLIEHLNPHGGGFLRFMDECWRVMKVGAHFAIATPYGSSSWYYQDPTHSNPCNENTFRYFDPELDPGLYGIYEPKPWRVLPMTLSWQANGLLELVLEKRADDPKYHMS